METTIDGGTIKVEYRNPAGELIPAWRIGLERYLADHAGMGGAWERVHRILVARALVAGEPVPQGVIDEHNAADAADLEHWYWFCMVDVGGELYHKRGWEPQPW